MTDLNWIAKREKELDAEYLREVKPHRDRIAELRREIAKEQDAIDHIAQLIRMKRPSTVFRVDR